MTDERLAEIENTSIEAGRIVAEQNIKDLIAALQAERAKVAELAAKMQWIPLECGYPNKEYGYVLVFDRQYGVHEATIDFKVADSVVTVEWWMNDEEQFNNVTHWMLLPERPTDGK